MLTGTLTGFVAYKYGFTWQALLAMLLLWSLISLAIIDLKTTLLPDNIYAAFFMARNYR